MTDDWYSGLFNEYFSIKGGTIGVRRCRVEEDNLGQSVKRDKGLLRRIKDDWPPGGERPGWRTLLLQRGNPKDFRARSIDRLFSVDGIHTFRHWQPIFWFKLTDKRIYRHSVDHYV